MRGVAVLVVCVVLMQGMLFVSGEKTQEKTPQELMRAYHSSWYVTNPGASFTPTAATGIQVVHQQLSKTSGNGLMNSSWPMYCHDLRHTGQSPYNTTLTNTLRWKFQTSDLPEGGPSIDKNGTIYIGVNGLYALNPNGKLKWRYNLICSVVTAPAIDKNGVIYFGTIFGNPDYLYALYPNGTLKWKYYVGGTGTIFSSPTIADNGTIYFGRGEYFSSPGAIIALNPNGTEKWEYDTDGVVYSSPAIGSDGTIYCGCHDNYLYALYPNNGTLKWRFKTGYWIRTSPCIADDGTIYCVSLDNYLYAINPGGTMKWRTDVGAGTSPTIGQDGTIYCGWDKLYAINPTNGSVKWTFTPPGKIEDSTPCHSIDGTIYFGTRDTGDIVAVNPNGTEKWQKNLGTGIYSPPAISENGTLYIGADDNVDGGWLYAFGNGPLTAEANGPYTGNAAYPIQFTGDASGGILPYTYHWDFGDGNTSNQQNPTHTYLDVGNYTATFTVTDPSGNHSSDTATVTISYAKPTVTITRPINALYIHDRRILRSPWPFAIGPITIEVNASETPLGIDHVSFSVDSQVRYTDMEAPFTWTWGTFAFFQHTVSVTAYDKSGGSASASLLVSKFF